MCGLQSFFEKAQAFDEAADFHQGGGINIAAPLHFAHRRAGEVGFSGIVVVAPMFGCLHR